MRMVAEVRPNYESEWAATGAAAQKLGRRTRANEILEAASVVFADELDRPLPRS
jgi:hypothetical protein